MTQDVRPRGTVSRHPARSKTGALPVAGSHRRGTPRTGNAQGSLRQFRCAARARAVEQPAGPPPTTITSARRRRSASAWFASASRSGRLAAMFMGRSHLRLVRPRRKTGYRAVRDRPQSPDGPSDRSFPDNQDRARAQGTISGEPTRVWTSSGRCAGHHPRRRQFTPRVSSQRQ